MIGTAIALGFGTCGTTLGVISAINIRRLDKRVTNIEETLDECIQTVSEQSDLLVQTIGDLVKSEDQNIEHLGLTRMLADKVNVLTDTATVLTMASMANHNVDESTATVK